MSDVATTLLVLGVMLGIAVCITVAAVAHKCGRSPGAWFAAALFFTPPLALLMLIAMGAFAESVAKHDRTEAEYQHRERLGA